MCAYLCYVRRFTAVTAYAARPDPPAPRVAQAKQFAALLDRRIYKVNPIPYNPIQLYTGSSRGAIDTFKAALEATRLSIASGRY